ncbi:MAG: molybdopterin oxidoreductase family protein [Rhodospirillales bacterium]|nr:molybdopterin oxidoreductase family protein [Rhodospirillales bacterium]
MDIRRSACPHDCPSGCALEVERIAPDRIGAVRGARENTYTAGVVCAKVARYAERVHHPERLATPLRRVGKKGEGRFEPIGWEAALDEIAEQFARAAQRHGTEAVWPYHSGGTMGFVQRYGLERFRHALRYSGLQTTICMTPAEMGWRAGVGATVGTDPRAMGESDLIVMWGGNPVSTQVNVMTHVTRARKERGAKLVVVDVYRTPTVEAADRAVLLRPGTDAAFACAVMHVLLAEGLADRDYLARYTDFDDEVAQHLARRDPAWAAAITGVPAEEIVAFARLYGSTRRSFLRLGFGFTRNRGGAAAMHAVSCLPAVTGAWAERGGGAFFINWGAAGLDNTLARGLDVVDPKIRILDQSRIGAILCGDKEALKDGPPVMAMLIQNANSAEVAPDSKAVRRGLAREDLFTVVHEQFMTATARFADIVLPATTFVECDDLYVSFGQTHIVAGPRIIEPYAEARSNHDVVCALAKRLGANHPGFEMSAKELLDASLRRSGLPCWEEVASVGWIDRAPDFRAGHFLDGFPTPNGRFRFKPDWAALGPWHAVMPRVPDQMETLETASEGQPFRLVAPPARQFLNTSFTETVGSRKREKRPTVLVHPADAANLGIVDGGRIRIGNRRGVVTSTARLFDGLLPGTVVAEGIWPSADFAEGIGINQLIGGDPVPPNGGAAFHDTAVWLRPAEEMALAAE